MLLSFCRWKDSSEISTIDFWSCLFCSSSWSLMDGSVCHEIRRLETNCLRGTTRIGGLCGENGLLLTQRVPHEVGLLTTLPEMKHLRVNGQMF